MTLRRFLPLLFLVAIPFASVSLHAQADAAPCKSSTVDQVLPPKDAAAARAFLVELQTALAANDKAKIATMVSYPMSQIHNGKPVRIGNAASFLQNFDRIFTPNVRAAVARQTPRCLFGNALGVVVNNGEVWFTQHSAGGEFKIITVNADAGLQ
jgi:hypothetical protein